MATATQTRTSAPDGKYADGDRDNQSTRSGGYFAGAGNSSKPDGTDGTFGDVSSRNAQNGPNGSLDRHSSQQYQNGHRDERHDDGDAYDRDNNSLSKGIHSIGLGSAGQNQSQQGQGPNGYARSPSYSSTKNQRPGLGDTPSRSYVKGQGRDDGDLRRTVTETFVEFDDAPTGSSTPTTGRGVPSGPAAAGFFPTPGQGRQGGDSTPTGQGLNNSVNDNYVERPGNQLHGDDNDRSRGVGAAGLNGSHDDNDRRESLASAYSQNTQRQSQHQPGQQQGGLLSTGRPEHRHAPKSHGSQYMIVENIPTPRKGSTDYTAAAANWDPAAGAVVESTPRGEYPPQLDSQGAQGAPVGAVIPGGAPGGYDQGQQGQYAQQGQPQGQYGQQDQHNQHSGLRNAGAAALGGAAGAAAGNHLGNDHHSHSGHHDDRYADDYPGAAQQQGQRLPQSGSQNFISEGQQQRLPQSGSQNFGHDQQQQQQRLPQSGSQNFAAVGGGGGGGGGNSGYPQQQQQYGQQQQDIPRSRSRQTSFREHDLPKSHSDRHGLAATAAGAGVGAGVGAGLGSGMRRSASAGSGLIRGNSDRRGSRGTGSLGHGSRPATADGHYRDKDRFRRGQHGYDERLPPVEDYDEDDEVRGLDVGQVISPSHHRKLQGGDRERDYDRASTQPRSRSAFGHRPQPGGGGYDEFGADEYDRPVTRAGTVRSTRSRRTAGTMGGGPRRGAFGQGAALSTGTNPHDVLSRQDLHERASLAERALSPNEIRRLQGMEKKDAKRLTKLMKEEERAQAKSLHQALADLKKLTRLQKDAIGQESKSQRALSKWTSREHKARLHFLKEKERYEAIEAKLRNAENDFEERRDHAYGLTEQVAERQQEIDDMRALKAADDRERAVKRSTLKHPGHA